MSYRLGIPEKLFHFMATQAPCGQQVSHRRRTQSLVYELLQLATETEGLLLVPDDGLESLGFQGEPAEQTPDDFFADSHVQDRIKTYVICSFFNGSVKFFYSDFSHSVTIDTREAGGFSCRLLKQTAARRFAPQSGQGDELSNSDKLLRENEGLRDRMSRLSAASLRINATLDLETVLGSRGRN